MVADLEEEYQSFLKCLWQQYSHETGASGESTNDLWPVYDNVSLATNRFLRDRLESLEENKE